MAKKKTIKFKGIEFEEVGVMSESWREDGDFVIACIDEVYYRFKPKQKKPKRCSKCGQAVRG